MIGTEEGAVRGRARRRRGRGSSVHSHRLPSKKDKGAAGCPIDTIEPINMTLHGISNQIKN